MTNDARFWFRYPYGLGGARNPDCFCVKDGWPIDAEIAFESGIFNTFVVQVFTGLDTSIPLLGPGALEVRRLELQSNGRIDGLAQFKNVDTIHQDFIPKNGLDLAIFPRLRKLICAYEKGMEGIFLNQYLEELHLEDYLERDCQNFRSMGNLQLVAFGGGKLKSLQGLEKCKKLSNVIISSARYLESLSELQNVGSLSSLSLSGLPKLQALNLSQLKNLEVLELENLRLIVDLSSIGNLQKLKKIKLSKVAYSGLKLDDLMSIEKLEYLSLPVSEEINQDILQMSAQRQKRLVKGIETCGAGKGKYTSILLEKK